MDVSQVARWLSIYAVPLTFAVVFHEVAHGWVADKCGDPTARRLGRLTLNPLAHIDPIGTVILPLILIVTNSPFKFGWAKPVPVNFFNLGKIRRDSILVAAAGPGTNLVMGILCAIAVRLIVIMQPNAVALAYSDADPTNISQAGALISFLVPIVLMLDAGIRINTGLMILNLVPILPLDGGRILNGLLPDGLARMYEKTENYGMFILIGLIFFFPPTRDAFEFIIRVITIIFYIISGSLQFLLK